MKLIDANRLRDAVLALPNCYNGYSDTYDKSLIIGLIDEQIVVDAVPVVRCWDCIYWEPATLSSGNCGRALEITAYKDDYCSYGEREDDEID